MLGGLFSELGGFEVFFISMAFFAANWSLMFSVGLLVQGLRGRRADGDGAPLPAWTEILAIPVTPTQMGFFTLLAAIQVVVVLIHAEVSWLWGALIAAVACVSTYALAVILTLPGCVIEKDSGGTPKLSIWRPLRFMLRLVRPFEGLVRTIHRGMSSILHRLRIRHVLETGMDGRPRLAAEHFFAATIVLGILALVVIVGWVYFPPAGRFPEAQPPAGAYLYILLLLLVWTLCGLDYHLSRFRVSPVLVLLLIMAVVYGVGVDHDYHAIEYQALELSRPPPATPGASSPEMTPAASVGENLPV